MKYVFIDLGCFDGDTIREFYNWGGLIGDPREFEIYGFDPSPRYTKVWQSMISENPKLHFQHMAASNFDGTADFTLRPEDNPHGSTLVLTKDSWGLGEVTKVQCFDFSKFLRKFRGDYVIVKMDIEGSEYEVAEKMIEDGTDDIPDMLFVEWHNRSDIDGSEIKKLKNALECEVLPWH